MIAAWQRTAYGKTPIYIHPQRPDWFVPNSVADTALQSVLSGDKASDAIRWLCRRLDGPVAHGYQFRTEQLALGELKECWLHVTNQCNMHCKHCMFQSSSQASDKLCTADCLDVIRESYELGCRIFYFTGGEPFLSKAFWNSITDVLERSGTHAVVLTNLTLIAQKKDFFQNFPKDRLHFQVSIDGMEANHDALRGDHAFERLDRNLSIIHELGFPVTLAMTVTSNNVAEMEEVIDFAAAKHVTNVHYLWLFQKGNARDMQFVEPGAIFPHLVAAQERAEKMGVTIDNVEILRSQIFSCPGTRYDLSNAGWQSLAVGPDKHIYPTPALIYNESMQCGHIDDGVQQVWLHSEVLKRVRSASLNNSEAYKTNIFRYLVGGGDIDHSYIHCGELTGGDPYVALYNTIAAWLIAREAQQYKDVSHPAFVVKMGEKLGECPVEGSTTFFTHSNCVLSLPGHDTRTQINQFYSKAAEETQEDILNPICYEESLVQHIPEAMRYRSYGCGSPVMEADIQPGEVVLDLGSGTGIECFIASKLTGPEGRVIGIDMGDAMLAAAEATKGHVVHNLQYNNIEFRQSFLEELPIADASVDLVISNCVLNLSPDKRRVFSEIYRILKPAGRLVISDITYNDTIPLHIQYNEKLRGECIGGALKYHDLFGLLNDIGFSHSRIHAGYHYRSIQGYDFYSITYQATKPLQHAEPVLYDFPVFTEIMKEVKTEPSCNCFVKPEPKHEGSGRVRPARKVDCMICGADLVYTAMDTAMTCDYCGRTMQANAHCTSGHFVCDACHRSDAVEITKHICLTSKEKDAAVLMQKIRSHPHFAIHGPEHHSLVPAVILAALKNNGHDITDQQITTAIERGTTIAGGACAFLGVCGAATGVGISLSVLLGATPYDGEKRQMVQKMTQEVLRDIASYSAPRCCQRDCWIALQAVSRMLKETLGMTLPVTPIVCEQFAKNKECIFAQCPLYAKSKSKER